MSHAEVKTSEGRQLFVAYWYERLSRHLLGKELISYEEWMLNKGKARFDIDCHDLRARIEVKEASNNDQLRLFGDQLDAQISELGFPFDAGFFMIFSYRNLAPRNGGKRKRLLVRTRRSIDAVSAFLAANTNTAYVIDIHLMNALRQMNGVDDYSRDQGIFRDRIYVNRIQLKSLAREAEYSLATLGFSEEMLKWLPPNAKSFPPRFIKTEMDGSTISFKLFILLQNNLKTRLLSRLNGNVVRV